MKTRDIVLIALFTALIVVLSLLPPIPLPLIPVPLTLQTFGVMLAGLILGPARAGLALLLYVLIALHLAGVIFETRRSGREIVLAMLPTRR